MRYHLMPIRMAIIKKARNKSWRGCGEKGTLMHCWEYKVVQPLWKTVWRFLKKINTKITIQSSNSTPGLLYKETENAYLKRYMHPYVHCSIIYNSQGMETT